jgi:hypothetical protein
MAIAEKKGLGDEMKDLVAKSGLKDFITGVSRAKVYIRLYDDAVRRRARLAEMIDKARQSNADNLARVLPGLMRAEFYDYIELAKDGLDVRKEKKTFKPLVPAAMEFPKSPICGIANQDSPRNQKFPKILRTNQKSGLMSDSQIGASLSADQQNLVVQPRPQHQPQPQSNGYKIRSPPPIHGHPLAKVNFWNKIDEKTNSNDPNIEQLKASKSSGELKTTTIQLFGHELGPPRR